MERSHVQRLVVAFVPLVGRPPVLLQGSRQPESDGEYMTHRALIVEDDPAIIHTVVDAMASLEHEYDTACSQEEALKRMAEKSYSYILLDIQIPARAQNGVARIQNTENLLEKISGKGKTAPPIVILSDYVVSGLEQTVDLMRLAISLARKGAVDIIGKPFPTAGRTLDRVIKKVLGIPNGAPTNDPPPSLPAAKPAQPNNGVGTTSPWLTVTQAANLLLGVVSGIDLHKAKARVSKAVEMEKFKTNGAKGGRRRIDVHSFNTWRLEQRDLDLDAAD